MTISTPSEKSGIHLILKVLTSTVTTMAFTFETLTLVSTQSNYLAWVCCLLLQSFQGALWLVTCAELAACLTFSSVHITAHYCTVDLIFHASSLRLLLLTAILCFVPVSVNVESVKISNNVKLVVSSWISSLMHFSRETNKRKLFIFIWSIIFYLIKHQIIFRDFCVFRKKMLEELAMLEWTNRLAWSK